MDVKYVEKALESRESRELVRNLAVDTGAALIAATTVTPIMTVIDRAVTEAASGHKQLFGSIKASLKIIATAPRVFLTGRPFAVMFLLYSGTFQTANSMDTYLARRDGRSISEPSSDWAKCGAVTSINMGLSMYKDHQFARTFGLGPPRPLPIACYPVFIIRDAVTIFASFNLPPMLAPKCSESLEKIINRDLAMQLTVPALSQIVVSPLHLLGLDLYNRQGSVSWRERMRLVYKAWPSTSVARMFRVFPAYGLGGAVNASVRTGMLERFK